MGNLSNINNKFIVVDDGNVLIGATSTYPQSNNTILKLYSPSIPRFYLQNTTTGSNVTDGSQFYVSGSDLYITNSESANIILSTGATPRMTIDSSGNVGIGTTSPGTFYPGNHNLVVGDGNADSAITVYANSANTSYLLFADGTSGGSSYASQVRYNHSTNHMEFATNDSTVAKMTLDDNGNVGIGTDSPLFGLSMAQGTGDGNRIGWNDGGGAKRASILCSSSTDALQFHTGTSDTERMRIDSSGNVGIGTSDIDFELQVGGTDVSVTANFDAQFAVLSEATTGYPSGFIFKAPRVATSSNRVLLNEDFGTYFSSQVYATSTAGAQSDTPIVFAPLGGNVGIGTTSNISSPLTIQTNQSANSISIIGRNNGANDEAVISFYEYDGTTRNAYIIKEAGNLGFATGTGGSATERMRIDSNGSIGMGDNVASYRLRVKSEAGTVQNGVYISAGTGNGNHSLYVEDKDGTAEFFAVRGDGEIRLNASSGYTYAAQGIRFGTNASANNLDDYEEGTWTPVIAHNNGTGVVPLNVATARYVKVGKLVYIACYLTSVNPNGNAGGSGAYYGIRGFPFAPENYGVWQMGYASSSITAYGGYSSAASLYFMANGTNGQRSQAHVSGAQVNAWGSSVDFMMNCVYRIN